MQWDLVPFNSLLEFVVDNRGRTCPTAETGIPLIATNCITNDRLYPSYESVRFVSQETYDTWFRSHPRPGDIIFVLKGTPGRACLVPDPIDFCIAQDMVALRPDPQKVDPKYLFAAIRSQQVQQAISNMHVGTLIPHFKKGDFVRLQIPLPVRAVQSAIGEMYFTLSRKIEVNRRINETLEEITRAIFKSWFVDFDPVRSKMEGRDPSLAPEVAALFPAALMETDNGEIPEGWHFGPISELADLNPETWSQADYPPEIEYVDLANTKWGEISDVQVFERTDAPSRAQRVLRPGDTIVGTVRPGNGAYALIGRGGLTGSTGFAVLRPKQPTSREFVYLATTQRSVIDHLAHLADGAAYPAVRPQVVAGVEAIIAQSDVRSAFAKAAAPLFDRIELGRSESRTLAALRDLVLAKLMSGEIRVKDAETLLGQAGV